MTEAGADAVSDREEVKFASYVKVSRKRFGEYGTPGVLALTERELIFLTSKPDRRWRIARSSIAHLRSRWWGMGSLLTFDVGGAYYALDFGGRGAIGLVSAGNLAVALGGSAGAQAGLVGDALAIASLRASAKVGGTWRELLTA